MNGANHRQWRHRHWFAGRFIPESALHVGSGTGDVRTDSLCIRDGGGQLFIPGTSLRGVVRSFLETSLRGQKEALDHLFGPEPQDPVMGTEQGWASRVVFHDLYPEVAPPTRIRDGVGIRRDRLAHRHRVKYDFETIPPGTPFRFSMYFNAPDETLERDKSLILAALEELRHARLPLGGIASRGAGWCRLQVDAVYCLDITDPDCLIAFLRAYTPDKLPAVFRLDYPTYCSRQGGVPPSAKANWLRVELDLHIEEPVVVNTQFRDKDYDVTFVRTDRRQGPSWNKTIFLPGSSIKGALRSRAEMILRTLAPLAGWRVACDPTDPELSCNTRLRRAEEQRQALTPEDVQMTQCPVCSLFGSAYYAGRVSIQDAFPIGDVTLKPFDWVAINRFTGGAAEAKKFNGELATAGAFRAVLFARNPLDERDSNIAGLGRLALIAHLLKDLHSADIPMGYGKFKGFGKLRACVHNITLGCGADGPIYRLFMHLGFAPHQEFCWKVFSISRQDLYDGTGVRLTDPVRGLVERLDRAFSDWVQQISRLTQEADP
jgi:CRISPR/Cas system CSM-associated protein Csm3 (group 7 of RAMP superfamily)